MGATHTKDRADIVSSGKPDGDGSPRSAGSRHGSPGSRCQRAEVVDGQPLTLPEEPRLTVEDKRYLKETWRTLESDPTTVGIITFSQLFEENPSMKDVFEGFRLMETEDIRASHELKQHAARVMGFVNKIISRLDSEDKYNPLMTELGCRHVSYGAKPQYIDMMGQQFIMVIRPSLVDANQWSAAAEAAWRKLFQVISYSMKMGLQKRHPSTQDTASPRRNKAAALARNANLPQTTDISTGTQGIAEGTNDVNPGNNVMRTTLTTGL